MNAQEAREKAEEAARRIEEETREEEEEAKKEMYDRGVRIAIRALKKRIPWAVDRGKYEVELDLYRGARKPPPHVPSTVRGIRDTLEPLGYEVTLLDESSVNLLGGITNTYYTRTARVRW